MGGGNFDNINSCQTDNEGNLYAIGQTRSNNLSTPNAYQTDRKGDFDCLIAKFDSSGKLLWSTYYGGERLDDLRGSCIDSKYNIYLTGTTLSRNYMVTTGAHQTQYMGAGTNRVFGDAYLAKFDSSGQLIWATYYGGPNTDIGRDCFVDDSDHVYLVGRTTSTSHIVTPGSYQTDYKGGGDAFIAKFTPEGKRVWGTYFGGEEHDIFLTGHYQKDSGYFFVGGNTRSETNIATPWAYMPQKTKFKTDDNGVLIKMSIDGELYWSTYYGGLIKNHELSNGTKIQALVTDNNSNIYITGNTWSSLNFATPDAHQTEYGEKSDAYLAKLDGRGGFYTSVPPSPLPQNSITLHPNPASDEITLTREGNPQATQIQVSDMQGKQVFSSEWKGASIQINTQEWSNGIYTVRIGEQIVRKVVIQK